MHIVCLSLSWSLKNFRAKYSLKFVLFVTLLRKSVSKFTENGIKSLNGKQVHQKLCCLELLLLGCLKGINLLQYQICSRALLISLWHDKEISHSLQIRVFVPWNEGLDIVRNWLVTCDQALRYFKYLSANKFSTNSFQALPFLISLSLMMSKQDLSLLLSLDYEVN